MTEPDCWDLLEAALEHSPGLKGSKRIIEEAIQMGRVQREMIEGYILRIELLERNAKAFKARVGLKEYDTQTGRLIEPDKEPKP